MSNALRISAQERRLRLCAAAPQVMPGDVEANAAAVIACIRRAEEAQADFLVLPELCLTGATLGALYDFTVVQDAAAEALRTVCAAVRGARVTAVVGLPYLVGGTLKSCAAILRGERVIAILPLCGGKTPFGFAPTLPASDTPALTPIPRLQVTGGAATFSAQLDLPSGDVGLLCSSANATAVSRVQTAEALRFKSARTGAALAYAAPLGESGTGFVFDGYCAVAAGGEILAESDGLAGDAFAYADVDAASLCAFEPFLAPIKQESYLSADPALAEAECARILELQAAALARRASHIGAKGFLIGVSGGLDSALALLASVAAAERLGMERAQILGVSMPGFGSSHRTKSNARVLVEALGCAYREIDITAACRQHFRDIGHDEADHSVVFENAQARERTQILLDLANITGYLDVGTGDLSEAALGWTTFGGDHLAQYGVNASIPKTVMRRVVAAAKVRYPAAADVLQDILDTPVSPELLPGKDGEIAQKTEELIGSYELHDLFLYEMLVNKKGPRGLYDAACARLSFPEAEVYRVLGVFLKRFFAQQFKRTCAPEAPLILLSLAPACFPFPSDMRARAFMKEYEEIVSH